MDNYLEPVTHKKDWVDYFQLFGLILVISLFMYIICRDMPVYKTPEHEKIKTSK